jgi:quercetin dioxygenase-like cupin family protein
MIVVAAPKQSFTYNGCTSNLYHVKRGAGLPRHDHTFPHLTMCLAGSVVVRKENLEKVMTPEDPPISLRENEWHEIESLEDGTVFLNMFAA